MAALKLSYVNPVVVKIPSSNFHAAGSRLIRPPHNVFMPSTTIHFPSVVLNRRETVAMKCCFTNNNDSSTECCTINNNNTSFIEMMSKENPLELVAKSIAKALEAMRKPAAAALVVGLLLLLNPSLAALAASGGRMGGSSFSNRSSSSSSYRSPSRSYSSSSSYRSSSSPYRSSSSSSSSSYKSSSSPSRSSSSSSSYSSPRTSAGKGSDFLIRPRGTLDQEIKSLNYIRDQIITESIGAPDVADALDKYKDYLKSYQNCKTENQKKAQQPSPSPLIGKIFGSAPASSDVYEVSDKKSGFPTVTVIAAVAALVVVIAVLVVVAESSSITDANKISVLKLQVGLLGLAKSLQKDLDRIAETADTSTPEGLHYVLTETTVGLLRHSSYWISTHSYVDVKSSMDGGEKRFNELSNEERAKFDEETLVNVNNIKTRCSKTVKGDGSINKYIVLTILVAVGGLHNLPTINNSEDLKHALQTLASIPLSNTLAVEVLWTPQKENDTLSEQELREDYPLLRPL